MSITFKRVALFGKRHREKNIVDTLAALKTLLHSLNVKVIIESETAKLLTDSQLPVIPSEKLHEHCDLIIVVGGDGSLLTAARAAVDHNLPVLGINRGRLGFLTDIKPDELELIKDIIAGEYQEEARFLLQAQIGNKQQIYTEQIGLNDAVLLPGDVAHMIEFAIYIDNEFVCTQRADGLIIATPTGSTAYALSGGGPILHPQLNAFALVPMFPHTLTSRPIVVSATSEIKIIISKQTETSPRLSCDGQEHISITPGDFIQIQKKAQQLRLIHPKSYQYFARLRNKLHWESKLY